LIDLLDGKEEVMKNALELAEDAPEWARKLEKQSPRTLEIFFRLFLRFKRRTNPSLSGSTGIKIHVTESINDKEFLSFAKLFCEKVTPDFGTTHLNNQHYPFTGAAYETVTFEMLDRSLIHQFLSIFKTLEVGLHVCWINDNLQRGRGIRINSPVEKAPFLFDQDRDDETKKYCAKFGITQPVMKSVEINLGRLQRKKRYCPFRIVYTRNTDPHLPGGQIHLQYSYSSKESAQLIDSAPKGEAIPAGKDVPVDEAAEENARMQKQREEVAREQISREEKEMLITTD